MVSRPHVGFPPDASLELQREEMRILSASQGGIVSLWRPDGGPAQRWLRRAELEAGTPRSPGSAAVRTGLPLSTGPGYVFSGEARWSRPHEITACESKCRKRMTSTGEKVLRGKTPKTGWERGQGREVKIGTVPFLVSTPS